MLTSFNNIERRLVQRPSSARCHIVPPQHTTLLMASSAVTLCSTMYASIAARSSGCRIREALRSFPLRRHDTIAPSRGRVELPRQIDELSYAIASALDKAGALPDPAMTPQHHLGVRVQPPPVDEKVAQARLVARAIRA